MRKAFFLGTTAVTIAAFVACVGDDPAQPTPTVDASNDAPASGDDAALPGDSGADASVRCNIEAPFTTVERVSELSTNNGDYGISFTADGLSVYVSTGFGGQSISVHTRSSPNVPFGSAIPLSGLPDGSFDYSPTISTDGKELFFAHRVTTNSEVDIYRADIGGGGAQNVGPAPGVNDPDASVIEETPFLANERALYFARTASPSEGYRIYRAERASAALPFSNVVPVNGLGTLISEASPTVTSDELHIYFNATEADAGLGIATRVMRASRTSVVMPFGPPVPVDGLDVAEGRDAPLWLSPDRCALYFLSDRGKLGTNDPDIWVAKRSP